MPQSKELERPQANASGPTGAAEQTPAWQKFPSIPIAFTLAFLSFTLFPPVKNNQHLLLTFLGIGGFLVAWELALWAWAKQTNRVFRTEFVAMKSHYVQALVQLGIYVSWSLYWPEIAAHAPLIIAQLFFLYAFSSLLTWSRGRSWQFGFGPLPIIFSTNLLLWFRNDWFIFQFLMVTLGALGKEFIKWNRDGRKTHIFNPSVFGQSIVALVLIFTGTTVTYTWGQEMAASFEALPHILIVIFFLGLIVQGLFQVTLMTLSATAVLCVLNLIYTGFTGSYWFMNINIGATVFLGLHLLMTDPSTSPRTYLGRVIFGGLYGLGYFMLFRILENYGVPLFWDKLLPVPILNLLVPLIDRFAKSGIPGKLNRLWETALSPKKMNLVHMGSWMALFGTMIATGFIESPHPGNSVAFWKKAYDEGRPHAGENLVKMLNVLAQENSGEACNMLGVLYMEGKLVNENHGTAARYFSKACELGYSDGCANVAVQYLVHRERRSDEDVAFALEKLEKGFDLDTTGRNYYLLGLAHEIGKGRAINKNRAVELYTKASEHGYLLACKSMARVRLSDNLGTDEEMKKPAEILEASAEANDAESCWYLALLYRRGLGVTKNEEKAKALFEKACKLGSQQACAMLR